MQQTSPCPARSCTCTSFSSSFPAKKNCSLCLLPRAIHWSTIGLRVSKALSATACIRLPDGNWRNENVCSADRRGLPDARALRHTDELSRLRNNKCCGQRRLGCSLPHSIINRIAVTALSKIGVKMPLMLAALLGGCDVERVVIRPSSRSRISSLQLPMPSLSRLESNKLML